MAKEKKTADTIEQPKKVFGSFLRDKILKVEPVESGGKWNGLIVNPESKKNEPFLFGKIKRSYQVPLRSAAQGGGVKDILDNQERRLIRKYENSHPDGMTEQEFFEKELGVDLNPRLPKEDNFWRTDKRGRVTLQREGMDLNLNNSIDMLRYKILMANPKYIAPSYDTRKNSLSYEFMIVDRNARTSKQVEEANHEAKAWERYTEITREKGSMVGFIKALGRTLPANHTEEWLKAEILNYLKEDYKRFLAVVDDPLFDEKIFVQEAIGAGAIRRKAKNRYELEGGVETGDLMSTINWLNQEENQQARLRVKAQIELAKK